MSKDEILKLEGDALNWAVAEKVMGWTDIRWEYDRQEKESFPVGHDPNLKSREVVDVYNCDLESAIYVVLAMKRRGYSFTLWDVPSHSSFSPGAAFRKGSAPPRRFAGDDCNSFVVQEPGGELATLICRAALLAVSQEKTA